LESGLPILSRQTGQVRWNVLPFFKTFHGGAARETETFQGVKRIPSKKPVVSGFFREEWRPGDPAEEGVPRNVAFSS
jgi:hypothetical protein